MTFIQQTKTSTTGKMQARETDERSFFDLVFLKFWNIRKDYYIPQQFALKSPTENDTVSFREHASYL